jgi:hypothetical protein
MHAGTQQVGAQDPERKNSPVAWENYEDTEVLRQAVSDEPACYFNDQAYTHGMVVGSGDVLLRCDHGLWIPAGPADPSNP